MEKLAIDMLSNAPAVGVLIYLVWRLDQRLQELQSVMIDMLTHQDK